MLFRGLDLRAEIVDRHNLAAGTGVAGSHVANGLLILGALADEGGLGPAAAFWVYGQVLLAVAALVFLRLVGCDLAGEIRRGNQAVALAVAGAVVASGNMLRSP